MGGDLSRVAAQNPRAASVRLRAVERVNSNRGDTAA